jgi:hypothetical protein
MPPRCVACQRLIAEHPQRSAGGAGGGTSIIVAGYPGVGVGLATTATRPDVTSSPKGDIFADNQLVVFRFVGLFMFTLGIVLAAVFGSKGMPGVSFVAPAILMFMGSVFTMLAKKTIVIFDKNARKIRTSTSRFPWICCGSSAECSFDDVSAVESRSTNVSINKVPQMEIVLRRRGGGELPLQMVGMWNAASAQAGWIAYVQSIGMNLS